MKSLPFWIAVGVLCLLLFAFEARTIDLTTLDLGRHLVAGKAFLQPENFGVSRQEILHTNLFSYSNPTFPFLDHHWAGAVLLYLIFAAAGWTGLSLIYIACILAATTILTLSVQSEARPFDIFLAGFLLLPLIAERTEIRPEGFSYVFVAIFLYILYSFSKGRLSRKWIYVLPILEIFWANIHIYFFLGPFIIAGFLFETLIRRETIAAKHLGLTLTLSALAACLTPFGPAGAIYPFKIFNNYGYRVVENQSIPFLQNLSFQNPNLVWYEIIFGLILLLSVFLLIKEKRHAPVALIGTSAIFGTLGFLGIRHMTLFALATLPLLTYCISFIRIRFLAKVDREVYAAATAIGFLFLGIFYVVHFSSRLSFTKAVLRLSPGVEEGANFIKKTGVTGPIFNNYDIGGYLIFNFFPAEKVFVDNRPEAYPKSFFDDTYLPMLENNNVWQDVKDKYAFNVIYFYHQDMIPEAQKFLINRIDDPEWAPVYVDSRSIIFLRRTEKNKEIISLYELPRDMFTVR